MHIAYLAPEIPSVSGTFVYEEIAALMRREFTVSVFAVHRPPASVIKCVPWHQEILYLYEAGFASIISTLVSKPWSQPGLRKSFKWFIQDIWSVGLLSSQCPRFIYQFLTAVRLARMLRDRKVDHLHIHFAHVPTQIGMYAAAMVGIPFTVMAHANDIFERGLLLPTKAKRAKKFLTISDFNCAYLQRCGVPAEKLAVVRCGVQVSGEPSLQVDSPKPRFRIGSLGRLVEKKGFDVLIEAVGVLRQRAHQLELLIAGDGPLRNELTTLVEQRGLAQNVTFVGPISHSAVPAWMATLDAFALACKPDANGDMDGIPVVLMEAMAQGLPVVSSRLSGIPELVIDQRTGLLAEPGAVQGLADQIERLISSPAYAKSLAQHGQTHVRNEFGQDVNIDRLLSHMNVSV